MSLATPSPKGRRGGTGAHNMGSGLTSVLTPGNHPSEGSWTEFIPAANVTEDLAWLYLMFVNSSTSGANRNNWVDIGYDPAGGSSYTLIAEELNASNAPTSAEGGICYLMPCDIPAGSSIAFRGRQNATTGGNIQCLVRAAGRDRIPGINRRASYYENVNSGGGIGVPITPAAYPSNGAWTLIKATTRDLWWWQVGVGLNDSTQTSGTIWVDLAWGDGTTFHKIIERSQWINDTTESCSHVVDPFGYCEVPAGSNIYARMMTTGSVADNFWVMASAWGGGK